MPNSDSLEALTAIATADYNHEALAIIKNNVNEIASSLHQYTPIDLETAQEAFKASVTAISLLKEQLLTMQPLLPVSVGIDPKLFETMSRELMTAEAQMKSIEEFVSENYSKSEPTKQRHLSSRGILTKKLPHKSSISKADYLDGGTGIQANKGSRFLKDFMNHHLPWMNNHAVKLDNGIRQFEEQDTLKVFSSVFTQQGPIMASHSSSTPVDHNSPEDSSTDSIQTATFRSTLSKYHKEKKHYQRQLASKATKAPTKTPTTTAPTTKAPSTKAPT
jgi:hypothetical protein